MENNQAVINLNNQSSERNAKVESEKREVWMDKMREAANAGFIPYAQYVKAFVPAVKFDNWSAWRRLLEYEGYVMKEGDFGWVVVEKPKRPANKPMEIKVDVPTFTVTRALIEKVTSEVVKRLQEGN